MVREEIQTKLTVLREKMREHGLHAVRFRSVDWFSWATGGGSSVVILTNEMGIAEVLVSRDRAFVLTNRIESARLAEEEVPSNFEIIESPWAQPTAFDDFAKDVASREATASDRPRGGERALPKEIAELKLALLPAEIDRYRSLGRDAAIAMTESLSKAAPDWSEYRLAGEGARAMWSRGIHATLLLVAGDERLKKHRHPFPSMHPLGRRAMMVFCARRNGLYANLTRFVYFEQPTQQEERMHRDLAQIEAVAFGHSRPGVATSEVYDRLEQAYASHGWPEEILNHHQGGPTGYLSREEVALPSKAKQPALTIREGMALAWNPSLTGAKIEDTVLVAPNGKIEILTVDPQWPTTVVEGRARPEVWVRR